MGLTRSKPDLVLENMVLRGHLILLRRQVRRHALTGGARVVFVPLAGTPRSGKQGRVIIQFETVLRWHRDPFRWVWRRKSRPKRSHGRPPSRDDTVVLIKRMAKENRT